MENNKTHKEKEIYTMMKLKQLEVTNENIGVLLMSDDVYLIRFKEENKVKLNFIKGHKDVSILPPKLSLVNIKSLSAKELRKILDEEEVANDDRFHKLLDTIFSICELSGFHIEERIIIKDKKTGKIWR